MKILIINDDGIHARGIFNLWNALKDFADLTVVAPSSQKSATGMSITLTKPLKIHTIEHWTWASNAKNIYSVNGTPADCVKLALGVIFKEPPDLIVSGINKGSNAGRNVLNSGTIGGVIEGVFRGIPGVAFSCSDYSQDRYDELEPYILPLVKHLLAHPPKKGSLYNVNFPQNFKEGIKGIKMAKQGRGYWIDNLDKRIHPEGNPYYWLGGKWNECEENSESDVALLKEGYATVVPLHIDQLTDHDYYDLHKDNLENKLNN